MPYTIIGGEPHYSFKINFFGAPPVSDEDMTRHEGQNAKLGLASVNHVASRVEPHGRRLAVIGGGPSIADNEDKIRNWNGDKWAVNGAYHWCIKKGIEDVTFIAADPHEIVASWADKVRRAIVTTRCHPRVFEVLKANDADVKTFDLGGPSKVISGSSTATAIPHLSALNGYQDVTFFGCESSYSLDRTHVYMKEAREDEMIVRCNGEDFYTAPDWLMQAGELRYIISIAPHAYHEESGGLLRAMLQGGGEYEILWVSSKLAERLKPKESEAA
jgi:hypothetical protein